jgi:hypothetical protein
MNNTVQRTNIKLTVNVNANSTETFNLLCEAEGKDGKNFLRRKSQSDFGGCFEAQKVRTERCIASDGNYFDQDNMYF